MDRCLVCHRKLKDEESITRKIGPTCWSRLRKLTKKEKARRKAREENKRRQQEVLKNQLTMFEEVEESEGSNNKQSNRPL